MILAGCTSKCQPMDVCINKPFKAILRKCWVEHVRKAVEKVPKPSSNDYKLPAPSKQDMIDWVEKAYNVISDDKDMVMKSFDVCGITTTNPEKVRIGDLYAKCMDKANSLLNDDSDESEDDPFNL